MENISRTIYGLTSIKDDYKIRYVGATIAVPSKRLGQHMRDGLSGKDWLVYRWLRKRVAEGFEIIMVSIEKNAPLPDTEVFWINHYRKINKNLMNSEIGGNAKKPGYKLTEEHKANISLGIINSEIWKPKSGHKLDDDHKAKISAGLLASGRDYTEQAKKISAKLTGRKLSDDHVAALKAAKRPKWTEETRIAAAEGQRRAKEAGRGSGRPKGLPVSDEHRAKLAEATRKSWGKRRANSNNTIGQSSILAPLE